jgi:hypothetical protein
MDPERGLAPPTMEQVAAMLLNGRMMLRDLACPTSAHCRRLEKPRPIGSFDAG